MPFGPPLHTRAGVDTSPYTRWMDDRRFDPETRSRNMSAIRSRDTGIELEVRRALHAAGFRFRLHRADLPGKPDIVLPRYRMAIFVDGCFWHGHDCIKAHTPKSNTGYWGPKIARTVERDRSNRAKLQALEWAVTVIVECELVAGTTKLVDLLRVIRQTLPE